MRTLIVTLSLLFVANSIPEGVPTAAAEPQMVEGAAADCALAPQAGVGGTLSAFGIHPSERTLHLGPLGSVTQPYDPSTGQYTWQGSTWEHGLQVNGFGVSYQDTLGMPQGLGMSEMSMMTHNTNTLREGVCISYRNTARSLVDTLK
jgi:hypothetical protein